MPNPVPLATKEEEERRAWVTTHHEVVRLVKDCFGDRFSNNEIFDRLKISRRTGYRALGNDDRVGKAPGRKPKIGDETVRQMIEHIESGGCSDVGNVWKHLADHFAPDCNPKTVQDAVKKSGFKNYKNTVKLEPLLEQSLSEEPPPRQQSPELQHVQQPQQPQQPQHQHHQPPPEPQDHQSVIDAAFHQHPADTLRAAVDSNPEAHVRWVLQDICQRFPDAANLASSYLCPYAPPSLQHSMTSMAPPAQLHHPSLHAPHTNSPFLHDPTGIGGTPGKRQRLAVCRRCRKQYDRTENTMETRGCLYHKGSPQKISPEELTIQQSPESYIWSCCGGNGAVRGCCRALHTTKKKRQYGSNVKKRDATTAGLDEHGVNGAADNDDDDGEDSQLGVSIEDASALMNDSHVAVQLDSNIDSSLQELPAPAILAHMAQMGQIGNGGPTTSGMHVGAMANVADMGLQMGEGPGA